jgi:hypothetical protein
MKTEMPFRREPGFRYQIPQEDAYIASLREYQRTMKDSPFMNDSQGHATLLADMMVGSADDYVLIYSRCLYRPVYEFALSNISPSVKVRLLYGTILNETERWWEYLISNGKDIIANYLSSPPIYKKEVVHHFFICDGVSVRYEISDEKTTAVANFNMPKVAKTLTKIFAESWKSATKKQLDIAIV